MWQLKEQKLREEKESSKTISEKAKAEACQ